LEVEDWLQDPLMEISKGSYQYRKLKNLDEKQYELWRIFHYATGLKLNGANFFCTKVIDTARTSEDIQLEWYLDAFFFELMSAYDTLLQELNIVYAYDLGLKPEGVRWKAIKDKLPTKLSEYMEEEQGKEWFKKVRQYRNTAAHHSYLWTDWQKAGWGDKPWDYDMHEVSIYHLDDTGNIKGERISVCTDLLKRVVEHIHQVWKEMAQEFD